MIKLQLKWGMPLLTLQHCLIRWHAASAPQLVPMFQHIQDIDYGDVPFEPIYAEANARKSLLVLALAMTDCRYHPFCGATPTADQLNATEVPAIGPSSHTNQEMSLMLQTELLQSDAVSCGEPTPLAALTRLLRPRWATAW